MKLSNLSRNAALAITAALAFSIACSAQDRAAEGSFDRTLKVSGAVDLTVSTGAGSITVRPGDASTRTRLGKDPRERRLAHFRE